MSIKTEIIAAINAEEAFVKINDIATLYRWQKDALGNEVDGMHVSYRYVSGRKGGWTFPIVARDFDGIIAEIEEANVKYMQMCAECMNRNLRAGYR